MQTKDKVTSPVTLDTEDMVVGFAFDDKLLNVALIKKKKPEWQKGYLNGVGGKVKYGESYYKAMTREFEEETGVKVELWNNSAIFNIHGEQGFVKLYFFYAILDTPLFVKIKSMTDETIVIADVHYLPPTVIQNLRWLIPMCLDDWITKPVRIDSRNLKNKAKECFET